MIRRIYVYIVFIFLMFFSLNLKVNAQQSYIIKSDDKDIKNHCPPSKVEDFNCGDVKRIESCKEIPVYIGNSDTHAGEVYISTYIFVYEIGYFEFGHISSVYAGKGFDFPNVSYKRTVYWDYYRDFEKIILLDARSGFNNKPLSVDDIEKNDYYKMELDKSARVAFEEYLNEYDVDFLKDNIKIVANDSNKYISKGNLKPVEGVWQMSSSSEREPNVLNEGENFAVTQEFKYNFCDAYVNLSGSNFSNVEYKCENPNLGKDYSDGYSKYFVPLLYPSEENFNFNIINTRNDFGPLNINGTCEIDVVNELFKYGNDGVEPRYYYRPIDIKKPFPDNIIPDNWKSSNDLIYENRLKRLERTYDSDIYYKIVLFGDGNQIGEINISKQDYKDYNDWSSINYLGISDFVSGAVINNDNSFCRIGEFKSSCDVYKLGSDVS